MNVGTSFGSAPPFRWVTEKLKAHPTSVVEAIHPEDRRRVVAAQGTECEAPETHQQNYRIIAPDGEVRWIHDRAGTVYDEDAQLESTVRVVSYLTEWKEPK